MVIVALPLLVEVPIIMDIAVAAGMTIGAYFLSNWLNGNDNANKGGKAPGEPIENDGYKPPKNWDGKKACSCIYFFI